MRSVSLVEEPRENQRPTASHRQTLSHNIVSSTPRLSWVRAHSVGDDGHWLHRWLWVQLPYNHDHDGPSFLCFISGFYTSTGTTHKGSWHMCSDFWLIILTFVCMLVLTMCFYECLNFVILLLISVFKAHKNLLYSFIHVPTLNKALNLIWICGCMR